MTTLTNPSQEEVRQFITQGENNLSTGIYNDDSSGNYPTHGLGINFSGKTQTFIEAYIQALNLDPSNEVDHYIYNGTSWVIDETAGKKSLIDEIIWLSTTSNSVHRPFSENSGIPMNDPIRLATSTEINEQAFDEVVYDAYLNSKYGITGVISNVGTEIWNKLDKNERLALYSLNYNANSLIGNNLKFALSSYVNGTSTENKMLGKLSSWYEILYASNGGGDRKGVQNRRFMEANAFLGDIHNKIPEGDNEGKGEGHNNSIIHVNNFAEANVTIAFMNEFSKQMINYMGDISVYSSRKYEIVQNSFSEAISSFLSSQNYTGNYQISKLFTEWNLYTDLQINLNSNGRPDGTTSYGNVTGSSLRDIIFITGDQNGTVVNAGKGDDYIEGGEHNDIILGGAGDDHIVANGGNDEVNGGTGEDKIYTGDGNDIINAGENADYIYPGRGNNTVDCGADNGCDFVLIDNYSSNTDTLYNVTNMDTICCAGGFDMSTYTVVGSDIHIQGNRGNTIIIKNVIVEIPEEGEENYDSNNMPLLWQDDGYVLSWQDGVWINSGVNWGEYSELPTNDNLDKVKKVLVDRGPDPKNPDDTETPVDTENPTGPDNTIVIPTLPTAPEDGTTKNEGSTTSDGTPIPDTVKEKIKELWETAETTRSPLAVDLDGNGIQTISTDGNIFFDHDGNGLLENTGWIGQGDGLLVRDINDNGNIDNGSELFGDNTLLSTGQKAVNGFEALKDLDTNGDNQFNNQDTAWNSVKVWKDNNYNAQVDTGELLTLEQAGISGINLNYNYQDATDEQNNAHTQTGTFIKTDGSTGTISDVWFDVDAANSLANADITISDEIKALPNIGGMGNVHSLHIAMALDTSGTLKSLIEQFIAETNVETRESILLDIIYRWTGVYDKDPNGRNPNRVYGNVLGDSRKLEALEEFMGEEFLGIWCWGGRDPNPHGHAAPYILQAFDELKNYVNQMLVLKGIYKQYLDGIVSTYNSETQAWSVDVSAAVTLLNTLYTSNPNEGKIVLNTLSQGLSYFNNFDDIQTAFQSWGKLDGTTFESELYYWGHSIIGTQYNDTLKGTEGNDYLDGLASSDTIYGYAGNDELYGGENADHIYGGEGNDIISGDTGNDIISGDIGDDYLTGGAGNDYLYGGENNDILIGGTGNDILNGGAGSDTYRFEKGFGNDTIDNTAPNASTSDIDTIEFGENILTQNVTLQRQGFDLIINISYTDGTATDTLRIYSYFDQEGQSFATVNSIKFADETVWDYEYVVTHWNSVAGVDGGITYEGTSSNDSLSGSSADDILVGNSGNDTLNANSGNDLLIGGRGNDTLQGGYGDDIYYWNLGDGLDTIDDNSNHDTISFGTGVNAANLIYRGDGYNLHLLVNGDETQGVIIKNFFNSTSYKVEELVFADGTNIHLSDVALTLTQSDASETVYGSAFNDTIYGNGGNDSISGREGADTIDGGAGNDSLYGASSGNYIADDDTLIGGTGNDYLDGSYGNDTYVYNLGDGLDTIYDTNGSDKIVFGEGISFNDFSYRAEGGDLRIIIGGDETQGIIIDDFFSSSSYKIETFEFADGSTVDFDDIGFTLNQTSALSGTTLTAYDDTINLFVDDLNTVYGGAGNDTINGGLYKDTIYGDKGTDIITGGAGDDSLYGDTSSNSSSGAGNDVLTGGLGNDYLSGNYGNDTYVYNLGDGLDTIHDTNGADKIIFGENIGLSDLTFSQDGNELHININNDTNQGLIIDDYFYSDGYKCETLEFNDGSSFNLSDSSQLIQAINSFGSVSGSSLDLSTSPIQNVSEMYDISYNSTQNKQAI